MLLTNSQLGLRFIKTLSVILVILELILVRLPAANAVFPDESGFKPPSEFYRLKRNLIFHPRLVLRKTSQFNAAAPATQEWCRMSSVRVRVCASVCVSGSGEDRPRSSDRAI